MSEERDEWELTSEPMKGGLCIGHCPNKAALSSLQAAIEAEVGRLRDTQALAHREWADESKRKEARCSARGRELAAKDAASRLQALLHTEEEK